MQKKFLLVTAAMALPVAIASAQYLPSMKEGLWKIHSVTTDMPSNETTTDTYTICRSHAYDDHVRELVKSIKGCTYKEGGDVGGKKMEESHCEISGMKIDTTGYVKETGDTAFHSEGHTKYTPAMNKITETTMVQDQTYVGACPAGMEPGDKKDSDGTVQHLWKH
jgi:hypothetical protein